MTIFTCKDNFEAMMTCIYDAWASKKGHNQIRLCTEPIGNLELFCDYCEVPADPEKAKKVIRSIQNKISFPAYEMIFRCAMSSLPDKLDRIYRFLLLCFAYPDHKITDQLQHPYVSAVFEADRMVNNETHMFREIVRFQKLPSGILISHIEPKSDILTLLAPAFDDRIPSENWMILDDNRRTAAVHPADKTTYFTILNPNEFQLLSQSEQIGDEFTEMWKTFFHTISIKERSNPKCQRGHLPLRYRKHMAEFQ